MITSPMMNSKTISREQSKSNKKSAVSARNKSNSTESWDKILRRDAITIFIVRKAAPLSR